MAEEVRVRRGEGLAPSVEEYLHDWAERSGIAAEVWALPGQAVPAHIADAVYATVVEALTNVERHSRAEHVSVAITLGAGGLRMTVSDDGIGYAAHRPGRLDGRGQAAMRANFAKVGGTLTINSTLRGGTTITGVIPV
ncbi:sensor histidine kinase [Sphaerisporangium sp. NPDC049003]|uniref:sensor histidine kinase n=1 Tax=Sphaerisporangium sp. NPDC049003 TaxID=3364517 RepID=UPI00371CD5A8